jgi:hypothetical protein
MVAVVEAVVADGVTATAIRPDVVGVTVEDGGRVDVAVGSRAGGPSGMTVVAGAVSAVVAGVGAGTSAAIAGAAAMRAVAATEDKEKISRLDIPAMIAAVQERGAAGRTSPGTVHFSLREQTLDVCMLGFVRCGRGLSNVWVNSSGSLHRLRTPKQLRKP